MKLVFRVPKHLLQSLLRNLREVLKLRKILVIAIKATIIMVREKVEGGDGKEALIEIVKAQKGKVKS